MSRLFATSCTYHSAIHFMWANSNCKHISNWEIQAKKAFITCIHCVKICDLVDFISFPMLIWKYIKWCFYRYTTIITDPNLWSERQSVSRDGMLKTFLIPDACHRKIYWRDSDVLHLHYNVSKWEKTRRIAKDMKLYR